MSMRKILRHLAKANMERSGMNRINRKMKDNTWRRVTGAWPLEADTGKRMGHGYHGRKDNKIEHKIGHGNKQFVYDLRFGNPPPRKRFNKQTGQWYYGPRKTLGKVVAVNEAG